MTLALHQVGKTDFVYFAEVGMIDPFPIRTLDYALNIERSPTHVAQEEFALVPGITGSLKPQKGRLGAGPAGPTNLPHRALSAATQPTSLTGRWNR